MCPISPPSDHTNISVFLERVFQECLTYEGEMDYKTYLDFVLAIENKREPAALQYLFRLLDIQGKNYLTRFDLNYFFRAIQQVKLFCYTFLSAGTGWFSFERLSEGTIFYPYNGWIWFSKPFSLGGMDHRMVH